MSDYDMPIYLSDWIVQVNDLKRKPKKVIVRDIIVKGYSKDNILSDPLIINKVLKESGLPKRDIKKSKVMNVILKTPLGYGIKE